MRQALAQLNDLPLPNLGLSFASPFQNGMRQDAAKAKIPFIL